MTARKKRPKRRTAKAFCLEDTEQLLPFPRNWGCGNREGALRIKLIARPNSVRVVFEDHQSGEEKFSFEATSSEWKRLSQSLMKSVEHSRTLGRIYNAQRK